MLLLTGLAVVIGAVIGIIIRQANPSEEVLVWVGEFLKNSPLMKNYLYFLFNQVRHILMKKYLNIFQ